MKAVKYSEYGGADVLESVEVPKPHPGPGQVRIAVRAVGVNPIDTKQFSGQFRDFMPVDFPAGVGKEAAGIIDEVGKGVSGVSIGDAVFGLGADTLAEYAILDSWTPMSDNMPFEVAGGLAVAAETALRSLEGVGVKNLETLLVSGAAGGVGSLVIQLALHRGVTVIGTATEPKHDYLRDLGAIPTTYGEGLTERVKALANNGVDAALDLAGAGDIPEFIEIVGKPSRVLSISDFSAPEFGAQISTQPMDNPERALAEAARLYSDGELKLHLQEVFPFDKARDAFTLSSKGHVTGKLVISIKSA
ncbi:NADP-dependent oxidoreductase [Altericroceibacterium spongiae]|uniref:NADP-dependent oxidoreductase n=1 Tax=Altericroceibacterium spongiae TaxID=2320269 RepID=A0A420EQW1_9SPHN|nr:NADP-dependent oxidoreductase [Altericroceibacterium spongiae]RKF23078.1 NADP-dependent oxidoreductase [Altericroceibacterium spongiae]